MKEVVPYLIQEGMSQSGSYILMVLEPESGIQVPIIIGQQEAQSIVLAKERVETKRPLTHELMLKVMEGFGLSVKMVSIDKVVEGLFYSTLHVSDGFNTQRFDCRTSDAIVLALQSGCQIMMSQAVIEEAGVKGGTTTGERNQASPADDEQEPPLQALEEELRRCEEREEYEKAAELERKIDARKRR